MRDVEPGTAELCEDYELIAGCDNCGQPATFRGYHHEGGSCLVCADCAHTQGRDRELTQIRPLKLT